MSETAPVWQCEHLKLEQAEPMVFDQVPVATPWRLRCTGSYVEWRADQLEIVFPENSPDQYKLVALKTELVAPEEAQLVVTAYKPGTHSGLKFTLVAGDSQPLAAQAQDFGIQSVLPNPPPEVYGPSGPLAGAWPLAVWLILALIIAVVSAVGVNVFRRWRSRRRIQKYIASIQAQNPMPSAPPMTAWQNELSSLRTDQALDATTEWLNRVTLALRHFLLREFLVNAIDRSWPQIERELKRSRQLSDTEMAGLRYLIRELTRLPQLAGNLRRDDQLGLLRDFQMWQISYVRQRRGDVRTLRRRRWA